MQFLCTETGQVLGNHVITINRLGNPVLLLTHVKPKLSEIAQLSADTHAHITVRLSDIKHLYTERTYGVHRNIC